MRFVGALIAFLFWLFVAFWAFSCAANAHNGAPKDVDQAIHKYFGYGRDAGNAFAVAFCESRYYLRATNGQYRGLWQFGPTTWRSVGGSGDPGSASADEQTKRARRLWKQSGSTFRYHWPQCGRGR